MGLALSFGLAATVSYAQQPATATVPAAAIKPVSAEQGALEAEVLKASKQLMDAFNNAITQQAEMVKAAGGWVASLSASVRPVVTYWVLFVWSFIHVWFAWNAWLLGAPAVEVFKTMMTPDFSALLSGTINYWFLDRTLKQRGI